MYKIILAHYERVAITSPKMVRRLQAWHYYRITNMVLLDDIEGEFEEVETSEDKKNMIVRKRVSLNKLHNNLNELLKEKGENKHENNKRTIKL